MKSLGNVALAVGVTILAATLALMGGSRLMAEAAPGAGVHAMSGDTTPHTNRAPVTNTLQSAGVFTVTVGEGGATFTPDMVIIPAGATVRWVWAAGGHNVTSGAPGNPDGLFCSPDDQNCGANPTSAAGSVYEHVFSIAGDYPYYCVPHGAFGMTGTVIVTDIANPTVLFLPIIIVN